MVIGGPHAVSMLEGRTRDDRYWFRTWALRALLYAWDPSVASAVVSALADEAWRVREMAAKVCLKRELGEAGDALALLLSDPVPRVRAAACRALGAVGEAEYAPALRSLLEDPDTDVRTRAAQALTTLSRRLDRPLPVDETRVGRERALAELQQIADEGGFDFDRLDELDQ